MLRHHCLTYLTHARTRAFARRVKRAEATIESFSEKCDRPYLGFSGGKDSLAMLLLLREMGMTSMAVFTQGDDLDWPGREEFCRRVVSRLGFQDYTYQHSRVSAIEQFATVNFMSERIHGTFSHVVARYVSERRMNGVLLGLRAEESPGRRATVSVHGELYRKRDGMLRCLPIGRWTGLDVFAMILSRDCEYFHVYDCDDVSAPHEIRMSWMLNPQFLSHGAAAFLRRHYPRHYAQLRALRPEIARYA